MSAGELKCIGSPLFLKNRYGAGYDLALTRDNDVGSGCDDDAVLSFVQRHVPSASIKATQGGGGGDMHVQLPFGHEAAFPDLFTDLDSSLGQLAVKGYGVAVTTLEQVFLRITEDYNNGPSVAYWITLHYIARKRSFSTRNDTQLLVFRPANAPNVC